MSIFSCPNALKYLTHIENDINNQYDKIEKQHIQFTNEINQNRQKYFKAIQKTSQKEEEDPRLKLKMGLSRKSVSLRKKSSQNLDKIYSRTFSKNNNCTDNIVDNNNLNTQTDDELMDDYYYHLHQNLLEYEKLFNHNNQNPIEVEQKELENIFQTDKDPSSIILDNKNIENHSSTLPIKKKPQIVNTPKASPDTFPPGYWLVKLYPLDDTNDKEIDSSNLNHNFDNTRGKQTPSKKPIWNIWEKVSPSEILKREEQKMEMDSSLHTLNALLHELKAQHGVYVNIQKEEDFDITKVEDIELPPYTPSSPINPINIPEPTTVPMINMDL